MRRSLTAEERSNGSLVTRSSRQYLPSWGCVSIPRSHRTSLLPTWSQERMAVGPHQYAPLDSLR